MVSGKPRHDLAIKITKQIGMGTAFMAMTLACILFAVYQSYGTGVTVGAASIFAFTAFHHCLGADEADQFAFAFVGFLCLFTLVILLVFGPSFGVVS